MPELMEYSVTITETVAREYIVNAKDEDEAERKALAGDGKLEGNKLISIAVTDIGATAYRTK